MTTKQENQLLRKIVADLHWMARRYADGRQTYATSTMNKATRDLLKLGVKLNMCDGTLWARDSGGRAYDGLTDEEAAMGREPDWKRDEMQRENERLEKELEECQNVVWATRQLSIESMQKIRDVVGAPDDKNPAIEHVKKVVAERDGMKKALQEIHIFAHCAAKAGPLNTPTLEDAWPKFLQIGAMATNALSPTNERKPDWKS